ncbi:filamentous hemagglutinin N-terminal domain-containing protein, partial [Salmonella enterica]|nr:filamentous hemagglutinin N-terminal domain-containing protein [Salmonella enterica]
MNRHLYRIIFNAARGMLMVVAEITRSGRLRTARRRSPAGKTGVQVRLNPLSLALWLAAGLVSLPAQAAIVADGSAPGNQQPTVLTTASGLPQVNIQTPNAQGVSRNQYSQFDVDSRGVILNNSRNDTATQLAGMVTGNPWLAKHEARIILNEVNSRDPSRLNGFIEVAGRRAEVVIASPAGITCAGCGFINASRTTLAAGQALTENGQLKGFDVNGGRISIGGRGLNAGDTDYTALIARAVTVNGKIHARELTVTAGQNVTDARGSVTRVKSPDDEGKPAFALDVAALGGMYASKITLAGTEKGLGVHNAGELGAMAGALALRADGQLVNTGILAAQGDLSVAVKGGIHNTGSLTAGGTAELSAPGTLLNEGLVRGGQDVRLTASVIDSTAKSTLAAGTDGNGVTATAGDLVLSAQGELKAQGQNLAAGSLVATGSRTDLGGSRTGAKHISLTAAREDIRTAGAVVRGHESITLHAATRLDNVAGRVSGGTLSLTAPELDNARGLLRQEGGQALSLSHSVIHNNQGTLASGGTMALQATRIENQGGIMAGNGRDMQVDTRFLDNRGGTVQLAGDGLLQIRADELHGHEGTVLSAGALHLTGQKADLSAGRTQARQITADTAVLSNDAGTLSARGSDGMQLNVTGTLSNRGGRVESGGSLTLNSERLDNAAGTLLAAGSGDLTLTTTADAVNVQGKLLAGRQVILRAGRLDNQAGLISATGGEANLFLRQDLNNAGGRIESGGALGVHSLALNNTTGTVLGQQVSVDTGLGRLTNTGGSIVAEGRLQMAGGALDNAGGRLQAGGDLHLNTHGQMLTNTRTTGAGILSGGALSLTTGDIDNAQGVIAAAGETEVNSRQLNNTAGKLLADRALTLVTRAVNNAGGLVQSGARLSLDTQGEQLTNTDSGETGGLVARGDLQLSTGLLDGRRGVMLGQNVQLDTRQQAFSHREGQLMARGRLRLDTGRLDNRAGLIRSDGDAQLDTHGQGLTNQDSGRSGGILSGGTLTLRAGDTDNQRGTLVGHGDTTVTAGTLDNRAGTLASDTAQLSLTVGETRNQGGLLQAATALMLDTQGQSLFNTDSGDAGGIRSQGSLTVTSGMSDNRRGVMVSSDMARLTTADLNNHRGQVTGRGGLALTTHTLTNSAGRLQSDAGLTINTQGHALENTGSGEQGGIIALKDLHLHSGRLDNQAGFIAAGGQADLVTTTLNNSRGQMAGNGGLSVHSQGLDNTDGKLQSAADLLVDTAGQALSNQRGHIVGDGQTRIDSGPLDNQYGHLQGGTGLTVSIRQNALNNQHGTLLSAGPLMLTAGALNNPSGELTSQGDGQLILTQTLDNTQGLVRAGHALDITAAQVINRDTHAPGKGIEAGSLTVSARALDNTRGALRATSQLTATVRQALENVAGLVSSGGALTVQDDAQGQQLSVNNRDGTLIAGKEGRISAAALSGDGRVLSQGSLGLHLARDFHNTRTLGASGSLTLETPAAIVNDGRITAGDTLTVTGQRVTSTAQAEISAQKTHVNAQDTLINTGLIDGGLTRLTAGTLSNTGTGRIYGDHVAVEAGVLNNLKDGDRAAVIAARERLDIGARTVSNRDHALITSLGDLAFGGALDARNQATGLGEVLNNHGATIEAGRDASISMREVNNTNRHLVTERVQVEKSQHHEAVLKGQTTRYDWDKVDISEKNKYGVHTAVMPDGSRGNEFYEYLYTRTVMETQIRESDPGKILAGGNLMLNGGRVNNHDSQVVAGATLGGSSEVHNQATKGERITTDTGWQKRWWPKKKKRPVGGTKTSQGRKKTGYHPSPVTETTDLKTLMWQGDTAPSGSGYRADARQTARVDTAAARVERPGEVRPGAPVNLTTLPGGTVTLAGLTAIRDRPLVLPAGRQFALTLPATLVDGQSVTPVIRTVAPDMRLPDSSLFTLHSDTDSHYLVETDPRFVNRKKWLTSDYMQDALTARHDNIHKRLGDGYYEQKLVRDQLIQLTGGRYTGDHTDDESQYRALMDNGIAFGRRYQLTPGVALSPAQMALLTTDIVWLVDRTVTLPDGSTQTVRVPQVYAKLKEGDLTGDGALLGGKRVVLNTRGDIINSGSVIGREVTQLTAQTLASSGYIQGNRVDLTARQDIRNTGGQVRAGSSLSLLAGRDITSRSTTRTDGADRWLDRPAGMYVQAPDGRLTLRALNNITLSATELSNAGDRGITRLAAGNDLRLDTVTTRHSEHGDWGGGNTRDLTQQADAGTRITTPGAVALHAGRDMIARAADVSAGGALTALAGRDIRLTTGHATTDLVEHSKQSSRGLLSGRSTETHDERHGHQALSTTFSGDSVSLFSGGNTRITGSNVVAERDVLINAAGNVTVEAATSTASHFSMSKTKKSGLMSSGGVGFSAGSQSLKVTDTATDTTQTGSTVGSVHGDVSLRAGNRLTVSGSDLIAGRDMALSGKEVSITAATDRHVQTHTVAQKTSGLTLALSGTVGSALNTTVETVQAAKSAGNSRLEALQGVKAALSGAQAVQARRLADAQGADAGNNNAVGVSLSYGSQSSKSEQRAEQTVTRGSALTAGNNLSIQATGTGMKGQDGDLTVQGSRITAGNNVLLQANRDVNLVSDENTSTLEGKNTSGGGSVGVGVGVGSGSVGISVSASANRGKGSEKGNGTTHTETTVDAGNRLTIV